MKKLLFFSLLSFNLLAQTPGAGVTDIDGNQYATVIIGTQEWMAENLRTTKFSDGSPIPNITGAFDWSTLTSPGWCWFQNNQNYDVIYGKLYNFWTVSDPKNMCPTGWHVPSANEWNVLFNFAFGTGYAGGKLKSTGNLTDGTGLWLAPNIEAIDEYGFHAVPGESRYATEAGFNGFAFQEILGTECYFWSSTYYDIHSAHMVRLRYSTGEVLQSYAYPKRNGFSIRCLKGAVAGIETIELPKKTLLKITDILGRDTEFVPNTVQIYHYSDGTVEKVFSVE